MVTMKKAITACLATVMLLGCSSCGSSSMNFGKKISLNIQAPEKLLKKGGWIQTMEDAFSQENPGVSFKNTPIKQFNDPNSSSGNKRSSKITADVFLFQSDRTGDLVKSKILGELSEKSEEQIKKQNPLPLLNSVLEVNKYYGVPYTSDAWFMYYDKSKLSKDDVKSLNTILEKQKVAINLRNNTLLSSFYFDSCITFLHSNPGMNNTNGASFNENCTSITKFLKVLSNQPNFINAVEDTGINALKDGSAAAYFSGIWDAEEVKKILGKNFAAAPLPKVRTDMINDSEEYVGEPVEYQMKQNVYSQAIGYNADSEHRDLAEKFAVFLGSTQSQKKAYELQKIVPSDKSLKSFVAKDPATSAQMQTVEKASITQPLSDNELYSISYDFHHLGESLYRKSTDESIYEMTENIQDNMNNQLLKQSKRNSNDQ